MEKQIGFMEFWEVLLYAGKDIRFGEAHDLYDEYCAGYKTKLHRVKG